MFDPTPIARETYDIWRAAGFTHEQVCGGPVGGQHRETSFKLGAVNDKHSGGAYGAFQWHLARATEIKKNTGIDVTDPNCSNADMQKAALWEIHSHEFYVFLANFNAAQTIEEAATTWVVDYEKSKDHASDIQKQVAFGKRWAGEFLEESLSE